MHILMIQPNYHSGGAEIAGNWPPSWVAYIGGALKTAGYDQIKFIDAMTFDLSEEALAAAIKDYQPDVVMATAITPMIYRSQRTLQIAKELFPKATTIMGGIHPTYMYAEVFSEAPWIDYIVRGEGEEIIVNLMRSISAGTDKADRKNILGLSYIENGEVVATPQNPVISNLDTLTPDWSLYAWDKYIYRPLNCRVAVPNFARGCPFTCRFCSQWSFWRTYRTRTPKNFVDEIENLVNVHKIGFFILADEEPTINKKKFVALCQEIIDRKIDVHWGINTRVTDILRDADLLPFYRKAGLVHVSLGTEAAAQLKLDRFRKQTTIEQNKRAIQLLQAAGMVAEAQFIMGMENETPETIEETYRLAQDWKPDMANWNMYTPWPFAELFEELGDRVEVRDYSKYNFVTPIIQPDNMDRQDVLKGVMRNYARFYMGKTVTYPLIKDKWKRKYMIGCLKAFAVTTLNKRFYDLKRVRRRGMSLEFNLGFDENKILNQTELNKLKGKRGDVVSRENVRHIPMSDISACGAPNHLPEYIEEEVLDATGQIVETRVKDK